MHSRGCSGRLLSGDSLNKKVIATRVLAAGILQPKEAFEFLKTIDYVDLISIGVGKVEEAGDDFSLLKEY